MKKCFSLFILMLCTLNAKAQKEQLCKVRELNSNHKPIANVVVNFDDAPSAISQVDGVLRLMFQTQKSGDWTFKLDINYPGYELVNPENLEHIKLGADNQLGVDILLARTGVIDSLKTIYLEVANKSLKAGFERELTLLQQEQREAKLSTEQYTERLNGLNKAFENQKNYLDIICERFARTNLDDVNPEHKKALLLFKDEKVKDAIDILVANAPSTNRVENTKAPIQLQQIAYRRLLADMYSVVFAPTLAESQYEQLLLSDNPDIETLWAVADFYSDNHYFAKAARIYPLIVNHPDATEWQVADAHNGIADVFYSTANLAAALQAYTLASVHYNSLYQKYPKRSFYTYNLSQSFGNMGQVHMDMGDINQAASCFEVYHELANKLSKTWPQNAEFKNNLGHSFLSLGITYEGMGNMSKALTYFERSNQIMQALHNASPQHTGFKESLAISYQHLGHTYNAMGNLPAAMTSFEKFNQLMKTLYEDHPQKLRYEEGLATSYQFLGKTQVDLGSLTIALTSFEKFNQHAQKLHKAWPQVTNFKTLLGLSNQFLGYTHFSLGNMTEAKVKYEEMARLFTELHQSLPNIQQFKKELGWSNQFLGNIYSAEGNLDKAQNNFFEMKRLFSELNSEDPNNMEFKSGLAISYAKLGAIAIQKKDFAGAKAQYLNYEQLEKELLSKDESNAEYINGLAISNAKLGMTCLGLNEMEQAKNYFKQSSQYFEQLFKLSPASAYFKANYYQSLAVLTSSQALSGQALNTNPIKEANKTLLDIAQNTHNINYLKRAELLQKMTETGANLKDLIIEITSFTL